MAIKSDNKNLHFIIGIGRSGTTILTKLLNSYKDVHCLPEANFLVFFLQKFKNKQQFLKHDIELIFKEIDLYALSHPWIGWTFNNEEVKELTLQRIELNPQINFNELIIFIYEQFKVVGYDKANAKILIDKNPSYTIFAENISNQFTKSKFIFITRDYRANILSRKQSIYLKSPDVAYNATRWNLYNSIAYRFYKANPNKVILVKYEDLVTNIDFELEKIRTFLDISSEKDTLNPNEKIDFSVFNLDNKFKDRFIKKYSDLDRDVNASRLDSWKNQLSIIEQETCDVICRDIGKKIGFYPISPLSFSKIIITYLKNIIPVCKGNIDILKDKIIYYFPIGFKLNRLTLRYKKIGFIK